ncbi:hypothetical protein FGO68_gene8672 [Halteria grandinella]|uniref:Uncharacterized protein n=1 Tax=Halteria grandinella TaxID=5974 RepID=A0A8J8NQJ0_HALGN|nr:hypothetical protein FGO68_gene8672 [Halteria grandinella]
MEKIKDRAQVYLAMARSRLPDMSQVKERLKINGLCQKLQGLIRLPRVSVKLPQFTTPQFMSDLGTILGYYIDLALSYVGGGDSSPLTRSLNLTIIILSLLSWSNTIYSFLSLAPESFIGYQTPEPIPEKVYQEQNEGGVNGTQTETQQSEPLRIPYVWTLFTSLFIETNIILLVVQLIFINRLLVYINGRNQDDLLVLSESMWTFKQLANMMAFVGIFTGLPLLFMRYLGYQLFGGASYLTSGYASLNPLIVSLLMGLRQLYPSRFFDTRIPFITGPLLLPFSSLPQLYLLLVYVLWFVLEYPLLEFDLIRFPLSLYFSWFYLRFIMPNPRGAGEIGDASPHFALHTFFPQSYQPQVQEFSERIFTLINESTGAFDYIQRKFKSPLQQSNQIDRKRALKELDEEIRALDSTSHSPNSSKETVEMAEMSFQQQNPQDTYGMPKKRTSNLSQYERNSIVKTPIAPNLDFSEIEIMIQQEMQKD